MSDERHSDEEFTTLGLWACVAGLFGTWAFIIWAAQYALPFSKWLFG